MLDDNYVDDLVTKLQWLVDNWPEKLEDNGITFPDGDYWPKSGTPEYDWVWGGPKRG